MIDFAATAEDTRAIHDIAKRAATMLGEDLVELGFGMMDVEMDVTACHLNGCPLELADLLATDASNFGHDIGGIIQHLDRETGELRDCFVPRFAAPETSRA